MNFNGNVVERYGYDPFGSAQILDNSWNTRSTSAYSWDYLHQGLRYDADIDKYHVRFRDYDPQSSRWLSMDPIGFAAGDVNLYRGVGNDFVGKVDPTGLFGWGGKAHYGRNGPLPNVKPGDGERIDDAIDEERKRGIKPTQLPELSPRVSGTINLVTGIAYMAIGIATAESGFGAVSFVAGLNRFLQGGTELIENKHSPTPAQNIAKATGISGADQGMQNLETFFDIFVGFKGATRCPPKIVAPAAGSSSVPEIVLGKQGGPVERLAEQVGGQHFKQAGAAGVFDPSASGWGSAFVKWMNKTIGGGKKVHFELEGVNINDALTGPPHRWVTEAGWGRMTEWELQTIMRHRISSRTLSSI